MPTHEPSPSTTTELLPTGENPEQQRYKTIAVRVEEQLHSQLQFISQLSGTTITDEIRTAIERRITAAQDDPDLLERAHAARQEIEREAAARSAAIAGFIGHTATTSERRTNSATRTRRANKTAASQEPQP